MCHVQPQASRLLAVLYKFAPVGCRPLHARHRSTNHVVVAVVVVINNNCNTKTQSIKPKLNNRCGTLRSRARRGRRSTGARRSAHDASQRKRRQHRQGWRACRQLSRQLLRKLLLQEQRRLALLMAARWVVLGMRQQEREVLVLVVLRPAAVGSSGGGLRRWTTRRSTHSWRLQPPRVAPLLVLQTRLLVLLSEKRCSNTLTPTATTFVPHIHVTTPRNNVLLLGSALWCVYSWRVETTHAMSSTTTFFDVLGFTARC